MRGEIGRLWLRVSCGRAIEQSSEAVLQSMRDETVIRRVRDSHEGVLAFRDDGLYLATELILRGAWRGQSPGMLPAGGGG